jgi:8-oxo-dGTP pyrophosphatase MutT (NUDIX family)
VDLGGEPEEAVKREAVEETRYSLRNPMLVLEEKFALEVNVVDLYFYAEPYDNSTVIVLGEGQGFGWFFINEAKKLKMIERDLKILEFVNQHLKRSAVKNVI